MRTLTTFALLGLSLAGRSQSGEHALVATAIGGQTALLDVDLATGSFTVLPRFPSDVHTPLAVVLDPVNGQPIVALDRLGQSSVYRVGPGFERLLGHLPGAVTDLMIGDGDVYATTGGPAGAVWRIARNGGVPTMVLAIPNASAFSMPGGFPNVYVAASGSNTPAVDPRSFLLDLQRGIVVQGPFVYAGHQPRGLTGLWAEPGGVPRQLILDEGGNVGLTFGAGTPVLLQQQPQMPPGGTRAMFARLPVQTFVLGGVAHPFLKRFLNTSVGWQMLAGPLPGDPVDFVLAPLPAPTVTVFGDRCTSQGPTTLLRTSDLPWLGTTVTLQLFGEPATPAALLLGASEQMFLGQPLPLLLPGGCELLVSVESLLPQLTDAQGAANQSLPVPLDPALRGGRVFFQGLQLPATGLRASRALALRLW